MKDIIRVYKKIIAGQVLVSVCDGYRWAGWMSEICCVGYRFLISAIDRGGIVLYKTTPMEDKPQP